MKRLLFALVCVCVLPLALVSSAAAQGCGVYGGYGGVGYAPQYTTGYYGYGGHSHVVGYGGYGYGGYGYGGYGYGGYGHGGYGHGHVGYGHGGHYGGHVHGHR